MSPSTPLALIESLVARLGAERCVTDAASLLAISKTTEPDMRLCGLAVFPENVEEVQYICTQCGNYRQPIWCVSGGFNWGYGTCNGLEPGYVLMHLRRMNRILSFDNQLGIAVIEPGVSQGQLNTFLNEQGAPWFVDCNDLGPHANVLGNALVCCNSNGFTMVDFG
jgi:4-cresol dehydrogenase (hydroxylating)